MTDKKSFSDLIGATPSSIPPDAKCCANCVHGRDPHIESNSLIQKVWCKALPPVPIAMPIQDAASGRVGYTIQNRWPHMQITEECDYFLPKEG